MSPQDELALYRKYLVMTKQDLIFIEEKIMRLEIRIQELENKKNNEDAT